MNKTKSYNIPKQSVWEAYKKVRDNQGAAGIDGVSIQEFEKDLKNNLYKIWNRMSSGSYFPPPVKAVEIPKKDGGTRILGVPTVADRIAQMTVKLHFEPKVEPCFHPDSYGYRPNKSALEAVEATRARCWRYNWVLEFDIKGLFDHIDHQLLMKAVQKHTDCEWIILYIQRWLKAPFQKKDGSCEARTSGTPQGGVISPVLANLFLHYTFDRWMEINHGHNLWARYADDAIIHCRTQKEAEKLLTQLTKRFEECKLSLHPLKTKIVYCKDSNRKREYRDISFDFLGYTFRPRSAINRQGVVFTNFTPAVSNKACKVMKQTIRTWRIHRMTALEIEEIARMFNPVIRGWINYYGRFNKTRLSAVLHHLNKILVVWVRNKYKRMAKSKVRAVNWLRQVANNRKELFSHWEFGATPTIG